MLITWNVEKYPKFSKFGFFGFSAHTIVLVYSMDSRLLGPAEKGFVMLFGCLPTVFTLG
jgi:hypothetical protein